MKKAALWMLLLCFWAVSARADSLVSLGDSIARGYGLEDRTVQRYSALTATALGMQEINLGENGQLAGETLDTVRKNGPVLREADLILLSIGANHVLPAMTGRDADPDGALAAFEADLDALLPEIRSMAPDAPTVLITFMNPWPGSGKCERVCEKLNGIIRGKAEEYGCLTAESAEALEECGLSALLEGDIHPGALGHRLIAEAILAALAERP